MELNATQHVARAGGRKRAVEDADGEQTSIDLQDCGGDKTGSVGGCAVKFDPSGYPKSGLCKLLSFSLRNLGALVRLNATGIVLPASREDASEGSSGRKRGGKTKSDSLGSISMRIPRASG